MKARQDDTPHLGDEESIILDMSKKKTELTLREVKRFLHEQFAVEAGFDILLRVRYHRHFRSSVAK